MTKPNAILVSVNFSDLLAITLPRTARHFHRIVVVSDFNDAATADIVRMVPNAELVQTNSFYLDGAIFNKFRAIEESLDVLGREGWICVLDADILLPEYMDFSGARHGRLYTPRRRILADITRWQEFIDPDADWSGLPLNRDEEWAGYFQLFHAGDSALAGLKNWYGVDWKHAGGGDSDFMQHWSIPLRARPPFEVLHLGEDGKNWCGRATPRIDGHLPPQATERSAELQRLLRLREINGNFKAEKIRRHA